VQKFPRRWDKLTCINFLQRKIILNCIAYYELNTNKLSDKEYDELSKQLVELQKNVNISDTQYGYVMCDFDGTTGFDLYERLNDYDKKYLMSIAIHHCSTKTKVIKKKKGGLF
jgi:hypothetical protein